MTATTREADRARQARRRAAGHVPPRTDAQRARDNRKADR